MTRTQKLIIGVMSILVLCVLCLVLGAFLNTVAPSPKPNPTAQSALIPTLASTKTPLPPTAEPTRIQPTATTPPSPTPVSAPNNPANQPRPNGLGVSRDFLVTNFQDLGFVFKEGEPVDGEPSHLGMQPDGTVILSIIGPPDSPKQISMTVFVSQDNPDANTKAAFYLLLLLRAIHPDWQDSGEWLTKGIQSAINGESVSITRNQILTKLELLQSLSAVMLTFEPVTP